MAMENGSLSASDVALLSGNGDMGFGNNGLEGLIYLAVIAAMFGGGFGFGGNGYGNNNAIQNDINRGFDNQNLQAQTRDILSATTNGTAQTIAASTANATNAINAIKDGNASLIREFGTVESALTALAGQQQSCCCDIKQLIQATSAQTDANIAESKYENAMNLAGLEQRLTSKLDQNKIEALQAQVSQLQLQNAMSGVLKFPNGWQYNAGPFPPIYGNFPVNV